MFRILIICLASLSAPSVSAHSQIEKGQIQNGEQDLLCVPETMLPQAPQDIAAAEALIKRTVPNHAHQFRVEPLLGDSNNNAFEIDYSKKKIVLRGNSGVAIASALYHYIKEYAHGQITWNGSNLNLPKVLPAVEGKVRKTSPYEYRYYLNYCTFNYSMSWWGWPRWEKEIDWMALHGINMPLAITGQEYIWYQVYRDMGLTEEELKSYFCGPAYFAWFWMGNLDGWGGPLPVSWMIAQRDLQKKILQRQRSLGMKPVLPAFTGHVPKSMARLFPQARMKQTNWGNGFEDTFILDSEDPLFAEIGRRFIDAQTEIYGTDHLYSADTFNENEPPSDDPAYLSALSRRVYEGMKAADPNAVWVMQGWLFYSDRMFWHAPQIKALLDAVPNDRMIILDLATEIEPVWKRTEAFYGKPWIWNMLHNFGSNISMFGRMEGVASEPPLALRDTTSGRMLGIGLTMEAIEQNPVLYELMTDHVWRDTSIPLDTWLQKYVRSRYGVADPHAIEAWNVLRETVYNGKEIRDGAESVIVARPLLSGERRWARTRLNYNPTELLPAWDELLRVSPACHAYEGFQYDLVDVTRQVLANYALVLHAQIVQSFEAKDIKTFRTASASFLELLDDMDVLLATRKDFMLGPWIAQARARATTVEEAALYERNARNLITLWGGPDNRLHEYSCRQWSGLISEFYKPRWQLFFQAADEALTKNAPLDLDAFEDEVKTWEWDWVNSHKAYPVMPSGNPVREAQRLHDKYRSVINVAYEL